MGYNFNPFIEVMETILNTLNVHIMHGKQVELENSTLCAHAYPNFVQVRSMAVCLVLHSADNFYIHLKT